MSVHPGLRGISDLKSERTKLEKENNKSLQSGEAPENSNFIEEVLVGMLLGDAWLEKQKVNARFRFEFFFDVFKYFAFYTPNAPKLRERLDRRTGKIYKTWHLTTLSSPFFTYYYDLFYKDLGTGYNKIIPDNIFELLTPVSP